MENLILPAFFVLSGFFALYRGSLFSDLQDGMNKYVYEKDRYLSWNRLSAHRRIRSHNCWNCSMAQVQAVSHDIGIK